MFTQPPTPEEFIELKLQKMVLIADKKDKKNKKFAKEKAEALENNNNIFIEQVIQAMLRGDDQVTVCGLKVKGVTRHGEDEINRLQDLVNLFFPPFKMKVSGDEDYMSPVKFKVEWFVNSPPTNVNNSPNN